MVTALGGMVLPALVFLVLNGGGPGERGWGIPIATDIAFAVGVLALFGSRVPSGLKVLLLSWVKQQVQEPISPAERLAHSFHPWTSCVVVPLFALANAGVPLSRAALAAAVGSPVTGGVVLGLVVGKLLGISGAAWLALRLRIGALPEAVTSRQLLALSAVAGVGFTVSLFITGLAYPRPSSRTRPGSASWLAR